MELAGKFLVAVSRVAIAVTDATRASVPGAEVPIRSLSVIIPRNTTVNLRKRIALAALIRARFQQKIPWNAWLFVQEFSPPWMRGTHAQHMSSYLDYPHWITGASNDNWQLDYVP